MVKFKTHAQSNVLLNFFVFVALPSPPVVSLIKFLARTRMPNGGTKGRQPNSGVTGE